MNKSMIAHIPTVTNTTSCMHFGVFFLKSLFFWYTVRSPFSGSINCDRRFTGKWASESLCGQSHLSSARGWATAAWGRTTELMGTLILTLLSWKATRDESKHRKNHRKADRQDREKKKQEDRVKNSMRHKKAEKAESKQVETRKKPGAGCIFN